MPSPKKKTAPVKTASATKKHSPAPSASAAHHNHKPATPEPAKETNLHPFPAPTVNTALSVLQHIVEATNGPEGFTYMPTSALELLHQDAIEVNEGLRNSQNHVAVRATKAGAKLLAEMLTPAKEETKAQAIPPGFTGFAGLAPAMVQDPVARVLAAQGTAARHVMRVAPEEAGQLSGILGKAPIALTPEGIAIETDVPPPADTDTNRRSRYPFDSLQVGHSFFVANTNEVPNQRKRLASSVANANKKYREQGIRFVVRDGVHAALGAGARVHRVS